MGIERTTCVVAGGGPAGMFLGLMLARAGIKVTVLEKHGDFLRDFRGDTVHVSTQRLLDELGLGRAFATLPQSSVDRSTMRTMNGREVETDGYRPFSGDHQHMALVPQWDLLNLLAEAGRAEPSFTLRMNTEVTGPVIEHGRVVGVQYATEEGATGELRAELTVAADGRWSVLRRAVKLRPHEYPVPMDTWWLRMPRQDSDTLALAFRFGKGEQGVALPRPDYYQVAYFNRKGFDPTLRAEGLSRFRERIVGLFGEFTDRVDTLTDLNDVKLLDVKLNRLRRWYVDGLLCIGDAAHAMSPIGGVGLNLAVHDGAAAARLLAGPLQRHRIRRRHLARVQIRRWLPTPTIQGLQRIMHRTQVEPMLRGTLDGLPVLVKLARRYPAAQYAQSYLISIGPLAEHAPAFARRDPG